MTSRSALYCVSSRQNTSLDENSPLDTSVLGIQTTRDRRQFGIHELYNLLEIILSAAEVCFANRCLALPSCTSSHLPQHTGTNKVPAHAAVMQNHSSCWPIPVSKIPILEQPYPQINTSRQTTRGDANEQCSSIVRRRDEISLFSC
jgi:hypothetical protein